VCLKVLFEPDSGRLLGAQSIGGIDGVDKRLDVIATALAGGLGVEDLAHLDLAYSPPFGSARDVINTAGFAGSNSRRGMMSSVASLQEAQTEAAAHSQSLLVIDVRDNMSSTVRPVPAAEEGGAEPSQVLNIPLEELRGRIEEVKALATPDRRVVTVCNLGKLSYFASRILSAHNVPCQSLAGGLSMLRGRSMHALPKAEARTATSHSAAPSPPASHTTSAAQSTPSIAAPGDVVLLDVCGIACPGPIMAIRKALPTLAPGQQVCVTASDPGFYNDFSSFCRVNGLEVLSVEKGGGQVKGQFRVPGAAAQGNGEVSVSSESTSAVASSSASSAAPVAGSNIDMALVVFSGEMDKVMAAFVLANGTLAMGGKVTMFFTFWGLNALKCSTKDCPYESDDAHLHHTSKSLMDRMLGMMLPKGLDSLPLSNLQMAGAGPVAMKLQMKQKHLPNLPDLLKEAQQNGARFVACAMSMEALGVGEEELIKGVELGGVADFLEEASKAKTTLFI
jgi:peroxiredoxin family protein/TusA-related sulfurtransferase/rhodanese-related sulfurtransferase